MQTSPLNTIHNLQYGFYDKKFTVSKNMYYRYFKTDLTSYVTDFQFVSRLYYKKIIINIRTCRERETDYLKKGIRVIPTI